MDTHEGRSEPVTDDELAAAEKAAYQAQQDAAFAQMYGGNQAQAQAQAQRYAYGSIAGQALTHPAFMLDYATTMVRRALMLNTALEAHLRAIANPPAERLDVRQVIEDADAMLRFIEGYGDPLPDSSTEAPEPSPTVSGPEQGFPFKPYLG